MDIHNEVDNILTSLSQPPQLRFEFHQNGCTIVLSNASGEHRYNMARSDVLTLERLFTFGGNGYIFELMEAGTVAYFTEHREQPNA